MELLQMVPAWVLFLIVAILVIMVVVMLIDYLKERNIEKIREDVYQLFLQAEHKYTESYAGKQKMKWVVSQARSLLPKWVQAIISDEALMNIIDLWFDGIKDLLDDGKMNGSARK